MKKERYTLLIDISAAIATLQRPEDFLRTIVEKTQPIFEFHDVGLFVVNEEEDYHVDLTVEMPDISPSSTNRFLSVEQPKRLPHRGSVVEWTMKEIEKAQRPVLFDFKEMFQRFPEYEQWEAAVGLGYRDGLAAILQVQGRVIGLFCINALEKDVLAKVDRKFFQHVADQIALALSNVLNYEQLRKEKQFKETLLSISQAVASIQDRKQMLKTIYQRIAPIFPYDAYGLFVLTEDGQHHYELIDAEVLNHPAQTTIEQQYGANAYYDHPGSIIDRIMQQGPGVHLLADHLDCPQTPFMYEAGLRQIIGGPLVYGGEAIGMLCFNSKQENLYTKEHLPLFQAISEQLSIATANVLANERVLSEKAKVEKLLIVSEVMATIQHRHQLRAAFDRISQVFPFDSAGLFVLDTDGEHHYELLDSETLGGEPTQVRMEARFGRYARYRHTDSPIEALMQREGPALVVVDELLARFPDYPQWEVMRQAKIQQIIAAPLREGSQVIGLLNFNSQRADRYHQADFSFFQAIAEQMSTVVRNILANEREQEQRQFKETLLSISQSIAAIQDRPDLFKTITGKIKHVFPFDELGIFVNDESGQFQRDLSVDDEFMITSAFLNYPSGWLPRNAGVDTVMRQGPIIQSLSELTERYPDHPHYPLLQEEGYKQVIGGPLGVRGVPYGMLCFWSKQANFYGKKDVILFQSIADQLSVAVSNVLVNEDIQRRERENALQVAIVNALNVGVAWEEKLRGVVPLLQTFIPFDLITIVVSTERWEEVGYAFERIGYEEYRPLPLPKFLKMAQVDPRTFAAHINQESHSQPLLLNGEAFVEAARQDPIKRAVQEIFGIHSMMTIPMAVGGERTMYVSFHSKSDHAYRSTHQALFERIAFSFRLAIEKQLNYQEVVRLNELIAQENAYLEEELKLNKNQETIGSSEAIQQVLVKVSQVANTNSSVLITGETGTGKELIARALHYQSQRKNHNFIRLNCATLPVQLLESELFGHERGAFTGAIQRRIGKFELAHQGTIFLDEIGEMPVELQAKLLRVLQEREFERLGGNEVIRTDVRIVAATNRDLPQAITSGQFRSDLYYRLNVFPIHLPPLRERKEDIFELAQHFIGKHNKRLGKTIRQLSQAALTQLLAYSWPGNVRELEHVVERAMITARGTTLEIVVEKIPVRTDRDEVVPLTTFRQAEINLIMNTLRITGGKVSGVGGAAEILEIHPSTLESKMRKLAIKRQHVAAVNEDK